MSGLEFRPLPDQADGSNNLIVLGDSADPRDREVARDLMRALDVLQAALDEAALRGLIVEPRFVRQANRFTDRGSDAEAVVAHVDVFRKLV